MSEPHHDQPHPEREAVRRWLADNLLTYEHWAKWGDDQWAEAILASPEVRAAILAPVLALHREGHVCPSGEFGTSRWFVGGLCPTARAAGVTDA